MARCSYGSLEGENGASEDHCGSDGDCECQNIEVCRVSNVWSYPILVARELLVVIGIVG